MRVRAEKESCSKAIEDFGVPYPFYKIEATIRKWRVPYVTEVRLRPNGTPQEEADLGRSLRLGCTGFESPPRAIDEALQAHLFVPGNARVRLHVFN